MSRSSSRLAWIALMSVALAAGTVAGDPVGPNLRFLKERLEFHKPRAGLPVGSDGSDDVAAAAPDLLGFAGTCTRSDTPLPWNDGDLLGLVEGGGAELGHFTSCTNPAFQGQYCGFRIVSDCGIRFTNESISTAGFTQCQSFGPFTPALGLCMPKSCNASELSRQMERLSSPGGAWWSKLLQDTYGFGTGFSGPCMPDPVGTFALCDPARSKVYLQLMECTTTGNPIRGENHEWLERAGPRNTLIILGIVAGLCGLATLLGLVRLIVGYVVRLVSELRSTETSNWESHNAANVNDDVSLRDAAESRTTGDRATLGQPLLRAQGGASITVPHSGKQVDAPADSQPAEQSRGGALAVLWKLISLFDVLGNLADLMKVTKRRNVAVDTQWMEGFRVLCMLFVVYGHSVFFPLDFVSFRNDIDGYEWVSTYGSIVFFAAELAVDGFFFMSGFLFYFLYHNAVEKQHDKDVEKARKEAKVVDALGEDPSMGAYGSSPQLDENAGGSPTRVADGEAVTRSPAVGGTARLYATDTSLTPQVLPLRRPIGVIPTLVMYLHRYLRIAPVMAIVLFFIVYIVPVMPSGPMYQASSFLAGEANCIDNGAWWRTLLFFSNADGLKYSGCAGWFWYLACDFQMYLFAPIVCALRFIDLRLFVPEATGSAWPRLCSYAGPVLFYLTVLAFLVTGVTLGTKDKAFSGTAAYFKTLARVSPYAYGVLFSSLIREPPVRRLLSKRIVRHALMAFGTICCVACINAMWRMEKFTADMYIDAVVKKEIPTKPSDSTLRGINFVAFAVWGLGLGCFALAFGMGTGGWLSNFLGHSVFVVLSKLTFCNYLIHPVVIMVFVTSQDNLPVFSVSNMYAYFGMYAALVWFVGAFMYVTVELPVARLNTMLIKFLR